MDLKERLLSQIRNKKTQSSRTQDALIKERQKQIEESVNELRLKYARLLHDKYTEQEDKEESLV